MEVLLLGLAGTLAGVTHALSGPDHLAAVLPLAAEDPRRAVRTALSWAFGHGAGTLVLAGLAALLRGRLHLDALGAHAEAFIGIALVATGVAGLVRSRREVPAGHAAAPADDGRARRSSLALALGALHGIAGGTHVVTVLAALALPTTGALGWLGGFVFGAGSAMAGVGLVARHVGRALTGARLRRTRQLTAALAVTVGTVWVALAPRG